MTSLAPVSAKLEKLIPMLSSDRDGEVVAAVRAIGRTLQSAGADWHDLAKAVRGLPRAAPCADQPKRQPRPRHTSSAPPTWESMKRGARLKWIDLLLRSGRLTEWEANFAASLRQKAANDCPISERQAGVLDSLISAAWFMGVRP